MRPDALAAADPRSDDDEALTVESYFRAFCTTLRWDEITNWPPDVFAFTNLILDHTELYRFLVAPPDGKTWPPTGTWRDEVGHAAKAWADRSRGASFDLPGSIKAGWHVVTRGRGIGLNRLRQGEPWDLCVALLTLHAVADEACAGLATGGAAAPGSFESLAWRYLRGHGSLCRISSARVRVVPKSHFAPRGITIRSVSRYVALLYEPVSLRWTRVVDVVPATQKFRASSGYNMAILPWPFRVEARDFRPVPATCLNVDPDRFGYFTFAPEHRLDIDRVRGLLETASRNGAPIDALFLPEGAICWKDVVPVEQVLADIGVSYFVTGVRDSAVDGRLGANYLHMGLRAGDEWLHAVQHKHHRWSLDGSQIRQYHLSRQLAPKKWWWEAIDLPRRRVQIVDFGDMTMVPLVCEDLARTDEVIDLLRRIGPSLVVAFLLDGPQLATRWPSRYASVLAEEPESAVLTLTSLGMALRSRPPGMHSSRSIALWRDPVSGHHEIRLARGAEAVLLKTDFRRKTVWTADGRCHLDNTSDLVLSGITQLRPRGVTRRAR